MPDPGPPGVGNAPKRDEKWCDLAGFEVIRSGGRRLGRVTAVFDGTKHPVLEIETIGGEAVLLPWTADTVEGMDPVAKRIHLRQFAVTAGSGDKRT